MKSLIICFEKCLKTLVSIVGVFFCFGDFEHGAKQILLGKYSKENEIVHASFEEKH